MGNNHWAQKKWLKLRWLLVCLFSGTKRKNKYIHKNHVFAEYGDNCLFQTMKLPNAPQLIRIHNNVKVAADVTFYEHDAINGVFSVIDGKPYQIHGSCIEILDNCFIGGHSIIVGNVRIGPNAIVAAGAVVTKDVPEGVIVAGNPARIIGSFESLHERRKMHECAEKKPYDPRDRVDELWAIFNKQHGL